MSRSLRVVCPWLLALVVASACGFGIEGNGKRVEEQRPLAGFVEIDNRSAFDVQVEPGEAFSVSVSVDENLLPVLHTRVVDDTLIVDSHENVGGVLLGPHVTVTMPRLRSARLSGSGRLDVLSFEQSEPLDLMLSGSGDLFFEGEAASIVADLSGSGTLRVAGATERLALNLDGSGSIDARSCSAAEGKLDLDGSGDLRATVHGPVEVSLSGSGDVDLYGGGTIVRLRHSGSGRVREH
jgi:hypothetical protein